MPRPPIRARLPIGSWGTVRTVTSATAAAQVRLAVMATLAASLAALLIAGRADSANRAWSTYLAPHGACKAADDVAAAPAAQSRAIGCLVNWARGRDRRRPLTPRPA